MAKERKQGCLDGVGRKQTDRWKGAEMRNIESTWEMDQKKNS